MHKLSNLRLHRADKAIHSSSTWTARWHTKLPGSLPKIPSRRIGGSSCRKKLGVGEASEAEKQTLPVIQAAEKWVKRFEGGNYSRSYLHPADYFNNLPIDSDGKPRDPSWVIPSTFIPNPLGGTITVEGTGLQQINETDSKLQALASFLPGGFKNRWGFHLWYGEWSEANGRSRWANVSDLARNSVELGTLEEGLSGRPIPPALRGFDLQQTYLCNLGRCECNPDKIILL